MLQVLSNNYYKAAEHRVKKATSNPKGKKDRYSAPFFFNPAYDSVIEPLLVNCNLNQTEHEYEKYCKNNKRN